MHIHWWIFTLALFPFLFAAWVKSDPLHAISLVKTLKRRRLWVIACQTATRKVNEEYSGYRKQALRDNAPVELIDELINERREKQIHELAEKLYSRWLSETNIA